MTTEMSRQFKPPFLALAALQSLRRHILFSESEAQRRCVFSFHTALNFSARLATRQHSRNVVACTSIERHDLMTEEMKSSPHVEHMLDCPTIYFDTVPT